MIKKIRKCRINLQDLLDKYKMAKKIDSSLLVDYFINKINLYHSAEVMRVSLLPNFKVPQIDSCDRSMDLIKHLETFKVHIILHDFWREIACKAFHLILQGTTWA